MDLTLLLIHNQSFRWILIADFLESTVISVNLFLYSQMDVCDLMQPYVKLPCFFDPSSDPSHADATTIHVKSVIQTAVRSKTLMNKQTNM